MAVDAAQQASAALPAMTLPVPSAAGRTDMAAVAAEARADLARRMKADWCGFGAAEHARQTAAIYKKAEAAHGTVGMEAFDEAGQTVGAEVLEEAGNEAVSRWRQELKRRGDVRSLALADFLDNSPVARARLQDRARTSSDPMVTVLALQRPCAAGGCVNVEALQWSRLEPANVQAWLTVLRDRAGAGQTQVDYVMDRLVESRYSSTYQREFTGMLLGLAQPEAEGLQNDAELQVVYGLTAAWPIPGYSAITHACRDRLSQPNASLRCETFADTLWGQSDLLEHGLALGLARLAMPLRPERRAVWEARAREFEAVNEWSKGETAQALAKLQSDGPELAPCAAQAESWQALRESVLLGEWEHARAVMRAAKVDESALAAAWRRDVGRGALDPPQSSAAASAAH